MFRMNLSYVGGYQFIKIIMSKRLPIWKSQKLYNIEIIAIYILTLL